MKKIKDTKGITLVALVITIIILLILATITIGQGKKMEYLIKAKQKSEETTELENEILGEYEEKVKQILGTREEENSTWTRYMSNGKDYIIGQEEINLPEKFEELHINVFVTNNSLYSYTIIYDELEEDMYAYNNGFNNGLYNDCVIAISKTKLQLQESWFNNINVTSNSIIKIWYK